METWALICALCLLTAIVAVLVAAAVFGVIVIVNAIKDEMR